jgi:hypothetical protein
MHAILAQHNLMTPAHKLLGAAYLFSTVAALSAPPRSAPPAHVGVACRSWNATADGFRLFITALDTSTADTNATRREFWHIAQVPASEITFVTDSATCDRAARAHAASVNGDTITPYPVHVLRVGPARFIAFNFTRVGEWFHYAILDSSFAIIGTRGS